MSAMVRAGYKLTEVGVIPGDWEVVHLSSLAEFITSGSRGWATYYADRGALFVRSQNVRDGRLDFADKQFVNAPLGAEGNRTRLKRSDLLITITGNSVGNVALVEAELGEAYISQHVGLVRLSVPLQGSYICRFLAPGSVGNVQIFASQSGQSKPGLSLKNLQEFLVALPPVPEQRAIATALSDVDALLAKLDALIAKKHDLKVATMQQLLTGQTRLPGFSGAWEVKRLGDVLSRMANGAVYKPIISLGIQITRIETIADGAIDYLRTGVAEYTPELERYKLIPGDILFSHINSVDHIGKVAIFNGEQLLYHGMNLLLLRTNKDADSSFLYFWFTSLPARRQTRNLAKQAVSQASINTKELKALEILLPPMPEQTAIATLLCDMDTELTALEARRDKTRALKQGMMQVLLTGEIRLL